MLYILVMILALAADRLTKLWATGTLYYHVNKTIPVIPGWVNLTYTENTGAAFGILSDQTLLLIIVPSIVVALIAWELIRQRKTLTKLYGVALSLLLAGALGNLIDRMFMRYVVDFIDFHAIRFAVFNVADICVTCGVALLLVYLFFFDERAKKTEAPVLEPPDAGHVEQEEEMGTAFPMLKQDENAPEAEAMLRLYRAKDQAEGKPLSAPLPVFSQGKHEEGVSGQPKEELPQDCESLDARCAEKG